MKQLLFALVLLFFVLGCAKYETEYAVNCQFQSVIYPDNRIVLVTSPEGEVMHKFNLLGIQNTLSEQFSFKSKDPVEKYDLHLIHPGPDSNVFITSHFDVPNGALVYLTAGSGFFPSFTYTQLQIQGIESFDSIIVNGNLNPFPPDFQTSQKTVAVDVDLYANNGMVIQLLANGESEFRHLYVPSSAVTDTVTVPWQDFKPENNPRNIEIPAGFVVKELAVNAVSPDFNDFVMLDKDIAWWHASLPVSLQFNHPDGLPADYAYRVRVSDYRNDFEKVFQPGEPIRFEWSDMAIHSFSVSDRQMQVQVTGDDIDVLQVEIYDRPFALSNALVNWRMDGAPASFKDRALPALSEYLPDWFGKDDSSYEIWHVKVHHFDKYDYPQVREGFPLKLNEPYAFARSGYASVIKYK